ncbi:hypothetical protein ACIRSS_27485 [Amycolatopsis sp. NPDC101161]|uniref:hypothetical protein n=1 Tax=Amycolatopsis sp. NPDC101161 TaxID=3363940 RepID=UPI00381B9C3D
MELTDALRRITHVLRRYADAPYAKRGWPAAQVQLLLVVDLLGDRPRMDEVKRRLGVTGRAQVHRGRADRPSPTRAARGSRRSKGSSTGRPPSFSRLEDHVAARA